jgi:pimeloyl-ACP methyl ester carboxylesterase
MVGPARFRYDQDLFVRQMAELLDSLRVRRPVVLASVSYGAAMVTSFADRSPERVRALVYLDPVFNNRRPLPPQERESVPMRDQCLCSGGGKIRWRPSAKARASCARCRAAR